MPLTDLAIRSAKPKEKPYKLSDEKGLYILVSITGSKSWRQKYRIHGKERTLTLGLYPDVSLAMARERRDDARRLVADGVDPGEFKQQKKRIKGEAMATSFELVAREWFLKFSSEWSEDYKARVLRISERDIFPWIGKKPISELMPLDVLGILRRIEERGAKETVHRAKQICSQVFRYALASGRVDRDITSDLKGVLPPIKPKHHASITDPKDIGALLRSLQQYQGHFATQCALKLAPLLFVRPGELRHAEWSEFQLDKAEWHIPAHKMKMREKHIVPLARQALDILAELHPLTGHGMYLFPSIRTATRPMSENTILGALRRLGYEQGEMTGHGFRSMASTLLNEQGYNRDAIERQLAHSERNSVRSDYNYAEYLPERRKMMQEWADYLDGLSKGADVIELKVV